MAKKNSGILKSWRTRVGDVEETELVTSSDHMEREKFVNVNRIIANDFAAFVYFWSTYDKPIRTNQ